MHDLEMVPEHLREQVKTHLQTIRDGLDPFSLDHTVQPWFPLNFGTVDLTPGGGGHGSR